VPDLVVVLGGGGHARVLIDCLRHDPAVRVCAVLDPNPDLWGTTCLGVPVRGNDDQLDELVREGVSLFVVGFGGTAQNGPRRRIFERGLLHQLKPLTVMHPTATCSTWATIGPGCQLLPGCIINAGAELGVNVTVNTGAIVEHDCRIGNHVHVATGARLTGAVHVGDGAHIGAGSVVRQSIVIGEDAVVGAGAVVVKNVERGQVVVGNPARVMVSQHSEYPHHSSP
jgi:sugar O-acyltransferase (sialic acid O-acetyltransferase NeuD family)